jgi:hypothetical protein
MWLTVGVPILVLVVAVLFAVLQFSYFLEVRRYLWYGGAHDRNSHYLFALQLATNARAGRIVELLRDLDGARMWPPLHGLVAAGVLLVGGCDSSVAVLPSLAGWVLTVVFAFLIAQRAVPRGGTLAGLTAVVFLLASPAFRAFATDILLESLGAALSLTAVHAYLVAVQNQGRSPWPGRWLGLVLTLLFLHKYNYWMLVVLALAVTTLLDQSTARWRAWWGVVRRFDLRGWLASELRRPSTLILVALVAVIGGVLAHGPRPIEWGAWSFWLFPPHNIIHIAYVIVFIRLVVWWRSGRVLSPDVDGGSLASQMTRWRQSGSARAAHVDAWCRPVIAWHLWPLAVWFLLPKRLGYFLLYVSPTNTAQGPRFTPLASAQTYLGWMTTEYHLHLPSLLLALTLFALALVNYRRLRPGAQAVLWLGLFGFALAVLHPNQKARFMHSWLPVLWVGAGMGLALLMHGRLTRRFPAARPWVATAVLTGLLTMHLSALTTTGHATEAGPHTNEPSTLELTDFYLPELDRSRRCTILPTMAFRPTAEWTFLERYGTLDRLEGTWFGFADDGLDNRQGFRRWLETTSVDTLVYLERRGDQCAWENASECNHAELRDMLQTQHAFVRVREKDFPHLSCVVTVWKRAPRVGEQGVSTP